MKWILVFVVGLSGVLWTGAMRAQTVTTFAGVAGSHGAGNGPGNQATFYKPLGIALDPAGNLYVADAGNNLIRKITPDGTVSTLAGSGIPGSGIGQGTGASFNSPQGVVVDSASGNVYVVDTGNRSIRKITSSGYVTTLASNGFITDPTGLALDPSGATLYVADYSSNAILAVSTSTGAVSNVVAPGAGGIIHPVSVAVDKSGAVYFSEYGHSNIYHIVGGNVNLLAGIGIAGATNGPYATASFQEPYGMAFDSSGKLYVADFSNNLVRFLGNGIASTFAGTGQLGSDNGNGFAASFSNPAGIAVDAAGNVYVSEYTSHVIRKISPPLTQVGSPLSLVGGRFHVTLQYLGYASNAQWTLGNAWQINDSYGYFGTSDPTSPDVLVKMINFCGVNNSWSVYISGATDVGISINIVDTKTGHSYQTGNTLGNPFNLVRAQAFSCP